MKTYLVRNLGDDEVIGVVRAGDLLELFGTMDEYGNPFDFEYLKLPGNCPGGFCCVGEHRWTAFDWPDAQDGRKWEQLSDMGCGSTWYQDVYIPYLSGANPAGT